MGALDMIFGGFGLVALLFWLIGIACMIWVIYDVLVNQKKMSTGEKIIWVVLAFFFSWITAIIYYFMKKR
jgi:uncharacterized protein with PQ loop repeat